MWNKRRGRNLCQGYFSLKGGKEGKKERKKEGGRRRGWEGMKLKLVQEVLLFGERLGKGKLVGRGTKMRKKGENYLTHLYYVEFLRTGVNRWRNREGGRKRERERAIRREGEREIRCLCVKLPFLIKRI